MKHIRFLGLALALLVGGLAGTLSPASAKPVPSPTPTPTPVQVGCVQSLTSGALLTTKAPTATTAPIVTDGHVVIFVGLAISTTDVAPAPVATSNGTSLTWLGTWYKKDGAPRDESVFEAYGLNGPVTFTGFPLKTHVAWSAVAFTGPIAAIAVNSEGGLEDSHAVDLGEQPTGQVITGFLVGQQGVVTPVDPAILLGQAHTSFITVASEVSNAQVSAITWADPPGHSIGVSIETTCTT